MHRPAWRRLAFTGAWLIGWIVLALTCRIRIEGERPSGAAILVSNHPSYVDGPVALWMSPRVRVIAKRNPYTALRWTFHVYDAYLTWRGAAVNGRRHLEAGGILWIVPEGGLSKGPLGRPRRGAAQLASETKAPIIPAAVLGTAGLQLREWRPWRRPLIRVVLDQPLHVAPGDDLQSVAHHYMRVLSRLTGLAYLGEE